jgi:type IV secretory pathway TrbL component
MLHYSVSAGAKLFVAQLIAALAQQLFKDINWLSFNFGTSSYDTIVIIGLSIMLFVLMWTIPGIAQGVVKGESASSPGSMVAAAAMLKESAAALAKAAAALSTGVAGLAKAGAAAGTLASSQLGPSASNGERLNRAMRNFGGAVLSTAGARLSNRINRSFFGEVAGNLNASEPNGQDNVIRGGEASGGGSGGGGGGGGGGNGAPRCPACGAEMRGGACPCGG